MTPPGIPRVSVVMPSYNQARYLEDAIRSVLSQTYPNVELFVVDGGSEDGSLEVIRRYAGELAGWVSEDDEGQVEAINKGLDRTSGKYVAWLNSDDLYLPEAVEEAVEQLEAEPDAGMVYANCVRCDADGRITSWPTYRRYETRDLLAFRILAQPTVFMRRTVLEEVGGPDPTFDLLFDHELWIRFSLVSRLRHVDAYWAVAREHAEAKNTARAADYGHEAVRLLDGYRRHPETRGLFVGHENAFEAGVRVFDAKYRQAASDYRIALRRFLSAIRRDPQSLSRCWPHVLISAVGLLGVGGLDTAYRKLRMLVSGPPDPVRRSARFVSGLSAG